MVVSPQPLELVRDFAIANAYPELDHIPLSVYLRCKSEKRYTCETRYSAWEYDTKYTWSHETLNDLRCILKDDLSNKYRIQFMDDIALMLPANEVAKSLTDYLTQAIDCVYPKRTTNPLPMRRGPAWFDRECREKRGRQLELVSGLKSHPILNIWITKLKHIGLANFLKNVPTGITSETKLSVHFNRRVVTCGRYCLPPTIVKVRSHMRGAEAGSSGRRGAENWLQHKSLHAFTYMRSWSGGGAGAKSTPQKMGPTPNFSRPLRNRAPQNIFVLNKWQIRPHPHRLCVNIPTVAERECQNPPVSTLQPLRACVNIA